MQKDEEVGKVAQATPIVICTYLILPNTLRLANLLLLLSSLSVAKALELFLAMIIEESTNVTVKRGAKKVEVYHLYVHSRLKHIYV